MNQTKVPTREELRHYLHHVLGFTRVKTATPGRRLYAHLVPGTKRLWIPLELNKGEKDIVDRAMSYASSKIPNPSTIPADFKIRKVGKKVMIYEERKPLPRRQKTEYPRPRKAPAIPKKLNESRKILFNEINRLNAAERKVRRNNEERALVSKKLVKNALNKITAEEREIKKFVSSMISRVVSKQTQEERNRLPPPTTARPYVGTRVRTSARNMYLHTQPQAIRRNISNSLTYKRLRDQGLSDKVARQLIDLFEEESNIEWPEPPKKEPEENIENYFARWNKSARNYPEEYVANAPLIHREIQPLKHMYGSAIEIPVQLRRRHKPDYKLYR